MKCHAQKSSLSGGKQCKSNIDSITLCSLQREESQGSLEGLPWWFRGKESVCDAGGVGSIPGSGKSLAEENGNPFQHSGLENPVDRGGWWATVQGVAESQQALTGGTDFERAGSTQAEVRMPQVRLREGRPELCCLWVTLTVLTLKGTPRVSHCCPGPRPTGEASWKAPFSRSNNCFQ